MTGFVRKTALFLVMLALLATVGIFQSWNSAFGLINLCIISAIMALGLNIQWGYAGLLNVGIMGFAALGGLATVLVSMPPVAGAWAAGGAGILISAVLLLVLIGLVVFIHRRFDGIVRILAIPAVILIGLFVIRRFYDPAVSAIEAYDPAGTGYLGGMGFPVLLSWVAGGALAAGAAWVVGKVALGLRADYLAIATLGISEIVIAILKNEDWLSRGVKLVTGLPRPVPYEVDLQSRDWLISMASSWGFTVQAASSLVVKLCYMGLFLAVLFCIFYLSEKALHSPWGRMIRAIRDNETAAAAMGKNVTARHLQIFVLGGAVMGVAGAMLTTLDGQFNPGGYQPLRFTFLIWVMVIVGGSGNNWGAVLGAFIIWFFWIEAEVIGLWTIRMISSGLADHPRLSAHLIENAAHTRLMMVGFVLLIVLRFSPKGLISNR